MASFARWTAFVIFFLVAVGDGLDGILARRRNAQTELGALLDLTPGSGRQRTAELWDRYQPQGLYDAKLTYRARGGTVEFADLRVWPKELGIIVDDEPVWLICNQGEIVLREAG